MAEYAVKIRNFSPLLVRANRSREQFTPGLDYVPGSTFRGAVAAHYLQTRGLDENFDAIFVREKVSFGNLLPGIESKSGHLLPATARLCKRYGWDHQDSLTDALLRLELADLLNDPAPLEETAWVHCPHPDCEPIGNKRDRVSDSSYYLQPDYSPVRVYQRLHTGTAIERSTGTVYPRMLFSSYILEENQYFWGTLKVTGDEQEAQALFTHLREVVPTGTQLWVGAARSRGLGQVEVDWAASSPVVRDLVQRWDSLNRAVNTLWENYQQQPSGYYFTLTLESDTLLCDAAQRPVTALDDGTLLGLPDVELRRHVIVPTVALGWNAQQGLPKPDVPALGRGSVLLFRVAEENISETQAQLERLETEGIGQRRGEGYGRACACDPFHYEFIR